jgi:prolyl oligopeptidase
MLTQGDSGSRGPLIRRGGRWFQHRRVDRDAEHPVLTVRSSLGEPFRVLVDPNELQAKRGVPVQVAWAVPSPDGSILAFGVMEAGDEIVQATLLDVQTGAALPDHIPWNVMSPPAWLPDSSGFWCTAREVHDFRLVEPLYKFILGHPAPEEPVHLPGALTFPRPEVSSDGRHVAIASGNSEIRLDYVIAEDGIARELLLGVPGSVQARFVDDHLIAIVDGDAPRGRIVRIPVGTAVDQSTWTELVPESEEVLRTLEIVDGRLVVGYMRDAACGVRILDLEGTPMSELSLPGMGVVSTVDAGASHIGIPMFVAGDGEISFIYSTFTTSSAVYRYVLADDQLDLVDPATQTIDGLTVSTIEAVSADGTRIPAHVVHRTDLDLTRSHPTLITGYGGFGLAILPSFLGNIAPWVEAGGIYVVSHLRGGGEFGATWWHQGSREHKQHTFDDLFAIAGRTVELGLSTSDQLAMYGASNGGVLAGAALAQRPELWAAVVADVPILDLVGLDRDPITFAIVGAEYGNPAIPAEANWLRGFSPYEALVPAHYPASLFIAGQNDPRCPAWHCRIFLARLDELQQGDAPAMLRVHADQGHGASGRRAQAERTAEWLAFCADRVGLKA